MANYTLDAASTSYSFALGFSLSGASASLVYSGASSNAFTLQAASRAFSLSGYQARMGRDLLLSLDPSSFSLTGSDSFGKKDYYPTIEKTDFVIIGFSAELLKENFPPPGSYVIDGYEAILAADRILLADSNAYEFSLNFTFVGFDCSSDRSIEMLPASFNLLGYAAGPFPELIGETGEFTLSGQDSSYIYGRGIGTEVGTFSLIPSDAAFYKDWVLNSSTGLFSFIGTKARLSKNTQYPPPSMVLKDTIYGPNAEFLGTGDFADMKQIKIDLETGRFVKIISNSLVISL